MELKIGSGSGCLNKNITKVKPILKKTYLFVSYILNIIQWRFRNLFAKKTKIIYIYNSFISNNIKIKKPN